MEAQSGACREDKGQAMRLSSQATSPRSMTAKQRQKKQNKKNPATQAWSLLAFLSPSGLLFGQQSPKKPTTLCCTTLTPPNHKAPQASERRKRRT